MVILAMVVNVSKCFACMISSPKGTNLPPIQLVCNYDKGSIFVPQSKNGFLSSSSSGVTTKEK